MEKSTAENQSFNHLQSVGARSCINHSFIPVLYAMTAEKPMASDTSAVSNVTRSTFRYEA